MMSKTSYKKKVAMVYVKELYLGSALLSVASVEVATWTKKRGNTIKALQANADQGADTGNL